MANFKDQCGLPTVAKLKQCIQSLATRLQSPDSSMGANMVLKDGYPCLEPLVSLSEMTRKVLAAYDAVSMSNRLSTFMHVKKSCGVFSRKCVL